MAPSIIRALPIPLPGGANPVPPPAGITTTTTPPPAETPKPSPTASHSTTSAPAPTSKPAAAGASKTTTTTRSSSTASNSATNSQSSTSSTSTNTGPSYSAPLGPPGGFTGAPPSAPSSIAPPSFSIGTGGGDPAASASTSTVGPSTPAASSSQISTTMIIGIAAGGLVGVALLVALVSFLLKRCARNKHDEALGDVFDRQEFKRGSVVIPDDPLERGPSSGRRGGPRPPTMIDRHLNHRPLAQPPVDPYTGYPPYQQGGYQRGYGDQGGYPQPYYPPQPSLAPGDLMLPPAAAFGGGYDSPAQSPVRDAFSSPGSGAPFLNHQLTGGSSRALTPQSDLSALGRGQSVTPFQAVQYAEIGRQLGGGPQQGDGPTTPVEAYARLDRQPSPPQQQQHPHRYRNAAYQQGPRPGSGYDNEDAYGGI